LCCSAADPLKYKTAVKTQQHQRDDQYFGWMNQIQGLSKQLAGCQGEFFVIQEHKEKGRMIKAAGISKHIIDYTLDRIKEAPVSLGFCRRSNSSAALGALPAILSNRVLRAMGC